MFGGKELTIAGPCFLSSENIICKFGETRVSGSTKSGIMRATCVSPPQAVIGDTTLSVSIDGGYHYFFSTEYIIGTNLYKMSLSIISLVCSMYHISIIICRRVHGKGR